VKPSIAELLDRAERLAEMAEEEALEDDPAILLNAAGKGWTASNLSMAAVIDQYTHERPPGTQTRRDRLEKLAKTLRGKMIEFKSLVGDSFSDLHLRASEQADYSPKVLRRRVSTVRSRLVPLARELCGE
jgi:hypothetical protein